MIFTILRRLQHSELGMFHAYRRLGKEGSKQRAINFDWDVVDRVFPAAKDTEVIPIECKYREDVSTVVNVQQWLKRQDKNWRLEGNCPKSSYYDFVMPNSLFAMTVDAGVTPATASWVVIPESDRCYAAILDHAESGGLASAGMIALHGGECLRVREVLSEHFPDLFEKEVHQMAATENTGMEPHPVGTFTILANTGHDLPSAVADLVDNAISAGATQIDIKFPPPNEGGRWMCVRDNGRGMDPDALRAAMRIGNLRAYESRDLGRFGFGLKGASWSQADTLTVISRALGIQSHLTWDKAHLERTGRWETLADPINDRYLGDASILTDTGTAVLLTNMRPPAVMSNTRLADPYSLEVSELRDHLGLVFHRFLTGDARGRNTIAISVNGILVDANNPVKHPLTRPYDQRQLELTNESGKTTIALQAFVLPTEEEIKQHHSADGDLAARQEMLRLSLGGRRNASQGLYFYRLDRLIKWGGWCGVFADDEHTKLLRVVVDFDRSADELMKVNISKREVQLSAHLVEAIKGAVKDSRADARSRYDKKPTKIKRNASIAGGTTLPEGDGVGITQPLSGASARFSDESRPLPPPPGSHTSIRVVAMDARWQLGTGFQGETTLQVSENIIPLVALVRAIEHNSEAKVALTRFIRYLDGALDA